MRCRAEHTTRRTHNLGDEDTFNVGIIVDRFIRDEDFRAIQKSNAEWERRRVFAHFVYIKNVERH